jgi:hypothetical protein
MGGDRRLFVRIPGHGNLIDQTLLGGLKVDQHEGFVGPGLLQFGRNFTRLGRGGLGLLGWRTGRSGLSVLDDFAIHMHHFEFSRVLRLHPAHQHIFELFAINLFEQPPEGSLRGHVILAGLIRAGAATQTAALGMIETLSELRYRVRPFAARRHGQSDQG